MLIDEFATQFRVETGIRDFAFSDQQTARIIFDGGIGVNFEWEDRTLYIYSSIGLLPEHSENLLREMLLANLFGRETGGASLALGDDEREIVLTQNIDTETLLVRRFTDQLESFIDAVADWMDRLAVLGSDSHGGMPDDSTGHGIDDAMIRNFIRI